MAEGASTRKRSTTAEAESTQTESPAEAARDDSRKRYTRDELLEDSRTLVGAPRHVLAGALDPERTNWTVDSAKKAVKDFLRRPVEEDDSANPDEAEA